MVCHFRQAVESGMLQITAFRTFIVASTAILMKQTFSILILSLTILSSKGQVVGKQFPDMIAETVEDRKVNLPGDVKGKFTLFGTRLLQKVRR